MSLYSQTTLKPGDIAIIGVNANNFACGGNVGEDVVSFVPFIDLEDNTEIDITDNGWERVFPDQWGDSEGVYRLVRIGGAIPAGTSFDIIFTNDLAGTQAANPDWTVTNQNVPSTLERNVNMNAGGDQIFVMQGDAWDNMGETGEHDAVYGGEVLYGFNTRTTWSADGTSQQSNLPDELDPCYFMNPTGGTTNYINYTGPMAPTTQLEWINLIGDPNNWTSYGNCTDYNNNPPPASISIIASGLSIDCSNCSGCAPLTSDLIFNLPTSGGPFNVEYTDGTDSFNLNGVSDGHTESVTVNDNTTYSLVSVTDINGCPVYSNFDGEAILTIDSGPSASITGGGDLCTGSCVTIDISISGGAAPYDVDMNVAIPPFVDFDFTLPSIDINETLTICSEGNFPEFDVGTLTLTVPELPGLSATVTLQGIVDDNGCVGTVDPTPLNITIYETPEENAAGPLNACDDGSGQATFDLTSLDDTVNGGSGDDVDWWSDSDATLSITSPYTTATTTVYATVSTAFCTSESVAVELIVDPVPSANPTSDEECDEGGGIATFDLISLEDIVNGGSGDDVNWYQDPGGTMPINSPYTTSSSFVYAEVDNGSCTSLIVEVPLVVLSLPFVQGAGPLQECDQGGGIATFDFTVLNNTVNGGLGNLVNWYSDFMGTNPISSPYVTGTTTIYATTFDGDCESNTVAVELIVIAQPIANPAQDELCGDINNEASFDLTALEDIVNGGTGLPVLWYDAIDTSNQVSSPYTTGTTTIYAVVYEAECRSEAVPVDLNVVVTPIIDALQVANACEFFVLEPITGTNLTGAEAYYDLSGGVGNMFQGGDSIFSSVILYAYDVNGVVCFDEEELLVTIEQPVNAGDDNNVSACVGNVFDLSSALINADGGGSFSDDDNTGALNGSDFDTDGLEGNSYQFTYSVQGGFICPDDEAIIIVDVVSEVTAGNDAPGEVCLGSTLDLTTVLDNADPGGEFTDLDNTGGLNGNIFDPSSVSAGTYQFEYSVGDGIVCPEDQSILNIDVYDAISLSVLYPIQLCDGECFEMEIGLLFGTPDFNYSVNISNNTDINELVDFTVSDNIQLINICNDGMSVGLINDTIFVNGNEGQNWTLSYFNLSDAHCRNDNLNLSADIQLGSNSEIDFSQTLCPGETIMVGNTLYSESNMTGVEMLQNAIGCDSIINVDIDFHNETTQDINSTLCFGQSIMVGGELFDENNPSGQVTIAGASVFGCDSTITVDLIFDSAAFNQVDDMLCFDDIVHINGMQYDFNNPSGNDTLVNGSVSGCDSIIIVDLNFLPEAVGIINQTLCTGQEIIVNGVVYNEQNPMGSETINGGSVAGCDSIVDINLNYESVLMFDLDGTYCPTQEFTINGTIYDMNNPTGMETFINGSVAGCDSTVVIDLSFYSDATNDIMMDLCPGESIVINGETFDETNTNGTQLLTGASVNGCDSTLVIDVSFYTEAINDIMMDLCPGESVIINGETFDETNAIGTQMLAGASVNGCDSTINIQVNFPAVSVSISNPNLDCINEDSGPIVLDVNVQGSVVSGSWAGDGIIDQASGLFDPQVFNDMSISSTIITYSFNDGGCGFSDDIMISAPDLAYATFGVIQPSCEGGGTGAIFVESFSGSSPFEFSVDNGQMVSTSDTIFGLDPGAHSAILINMNGCSDQDQVFIDNVFIPVVDAGPDLSLLIGESGLITVQTDATPVTISWDPPNGLSCIDCLNPMASPQSTTTYTITIVDEFGCTISDEVRVEVRLDNDIYFANAFSPNKDGINDFFYPQASDSFSGVIDMYIYDRWGNQVFNGENIIHNVPELGWDGSYRGKEMKPGVFVYQMKVDFGNGDIQTFTGDVSLIK